MNGKGLGDSQKNNSHHGGDYLFLCEAEKQMSSMNEHNRKSHKQIKESCSKRHNVNNRPEPEKHKNVSKERPCWGDSGPSQSEKRCHDDSKNHSEKDKSPSSNNHQEHQKPDVLTSSSMSEDFQKLHEYSYEELLLKKREVEKQMDALNCQISETQQDPNEDGRQSGEKKRKGESDLSGEGPDKKLKTAQPERPEIRYSGINVSSPIEDFYDERLPSYIIEALHKQKIKEPTPIQSTAWPIAMSGRDLVGIAQTGSGKTLAYVVPALVHIYNQSSMLKDDGPIALVLAPTRELALQINDVCSMFRKFTKTKNCCVFGGSSKTEQLKEIERGLDICIATPGRLLDFVQSEDLSLRRCTFLVLDEADIMLDMGFEPQVRKVMKSISRYCQTLMFSATWPEKVWKIAKDLLNDYIKVNIGSTSLSANHNITQNVYVVEECDKENRLIALLQNIMKEKENKTIVFAEKKKRVEDLNQYIHEQGFSTICIHGGKTQNQRIQIFDDFKEGEIPILVGTDLASRGLNVVDIKHVINFDFPKQFEQYIHRIGRTGRINKKGTAHTFFTLQNSKMAKPLIDVLVEANQTINPMLMNLVEMPNRFKR